MDTCRICYEPENLVSICGCDGTAKFVHVACVQRWIDTSGRKICELCNQPFTHTSLVFNYVKYPIRLERWIFMSAFLGIVHGATIWSEENDDTAWLYLACAFMYNIANAMVMIFVGSRNHPIWKNATIFLTGFVVAHLPMQFFTPVNIALAFTYAFNVVIFFMALSIDMGIRWSRRQPAHQNNVIANNPTQQGQIQEMIRVD